jgi:pyrroloquinoline-quinone synthase
MTTQQSITPMTPGAPPVAEEMLSALKAVCARRSLLTNDYFRHLQEGTMSQAGFQQSQAQFYFAVRFFSRAMATLAARLPDSRRRMALVHNLAEEHGDFQAAQAHDRTFVQFLASVGWGPERLAQTIEGPEVAAFNYGLLGVCAMGEPDVALAGLGVIEDSFASIAVMIGESVVRRGWVEPGRLVHYALHAELDQRHAEDLFREIEPAWTGGGEGRARVLSGWELGLHLFARLYSDLDRVAMLLS